LLVNIGINYHWLSNTSSPTLQLIIKLVISCTKFNKPFIG
jgi:hypothetical protein